MYAAPEEWPRVNSEGVSDGLNELVVFFLLMNFVLHCSPIIHSHLNLCHHLLHSSVITSISICHHYHMKLKVPYHHLTSLLHPNSYIHPSSHNPLPSPNSKNLTFEWAATILHWTVGEVCPTNSGILSSRAGQDRTPLHHNRETQTGRHQDASPSHQLRLSVRALWSHLAVGEECPTNSGILVHAPDKITHHYAIARGA